MKATAILIPALCVSLLALEITCCKLSIQLRSAETRNQLEFQKQIGAWASCDTSFFSSASVCTAVLPTGPIRFRCDEDRCQLECGGGK